MKMALGRLENLQGLLRDAQHFLSCREKAGENTSCSRSSCFPKQKLVMILELKVVDVVVVVVQILILRNKFL